MQGVVKSEGERQTVLGEDEAPTHRGIKQEMPASPSVSCVTAAARVYH